MLQKEFEEVEAVPGTWRTLGMELNSEQRPAGMPDTFNGAVVQVGHPDLPVVRERFGINSIAMVLARDPAGAGSRHDYRLIL